MAKFGDQKKKNLGAEEFCYGTSHDSQGSFGLINKTSEGPTWSSIDLTQGCDSHFGLRWQNSASTILSSGGQSLKVKICCITDALTVDSDSPT